MSRVAILQSSSLYHHVELLAIAIQLSLRVFGTNIYIYTYSDTTVRLSVRVGTEGNGGTVTHLSLRVFGTEESRLSDDSINMVLSPGCARSESYNESKTRAGIYARAEQS